MVKNKAVVSRYRPITQLHHRPNDPRPSLLLCDTTEPSQIDVRYIVPLTMIVSSSNMVNTVTDGATNFIICTLPRRADNILYRDFKVLPHHFLFVCHKPSSFTFP